jgi:hypothetical protein
MTGQQDETRTVHLCVPLSIALPTENPAEQTPFRPWEMSPLFGARLCERECVRACVRAAMATGQRGDSCTSLPRISRRIRLALEFGLKKALS